MTMKEITSDYDPINDQKYMSEEMLNYFKNKLEKLKQEILENEAVLEQDMRDTKGRESDYVDQGVNEELHHSEFALFEHDEQLLEEVNAALERINNGEYGYSLASNEPIDVKRLKLVPWAKYTVDEQEKVEKEEE